MGGFIGGGSGGSSGVSIGDAIGSGTAGSVLFVDGAGDLGEDNANLFFNDTNNNLGIGVAPVAGTRLTLPLENDGATPTFAFGDGDSGFYESADDTIRVSTAGVIRARFNSNGLEMEGSAGFTAASIMNEVASATNPTLVPRSPDYATGIGSSGTGVVNIVSGGVEQAGFRTTGNHTIDSLLDGATGDEVGLTLTSTVNKATSGDDFVLVVDRTVTTAPGTDNRLVDLRNGGSSVFSVDPNGTLRSAGGQQMPVRTVTTTATASVNDYHIRCDSSGGPFTLTLPVASGNIGTILSIKRVAGGSTVTISPAGSDTIDDAASVSLANDSEGVLLIAGNSVNWDIISQIPS